MPKDLAALLLEEGVVPADRLAQAQARQREAGGLLDTALLELGLLDEETLVGWLSRAAELPPAPPEAWSAADARARRVFPSRVAERNALAPFRLDGRELSLVATVPVDATLLDEISFMLSLHLSAHVGPEWRVRELIHRLYGTPLEPRFAALGSPAAPAAVEEDAPPAPAAGAATEAAPVAPDEERPDAPAEGLRPPRAGFTVGGEPLEPLAAALAEAIEAAEPDAGPEEPPPPGELAAEEPPSQAAPVDRSLRPGWSLADARAALAAARHRDEVVLAALRYAGDFFEFAAMFAVTRDAVAGHDAVGPEGDDARMLCRSVAIYASDPGIFRTVIETRSPYLGPVARDASGTDAILGGLGRGAAGTVLVFPVLLRDRPVCVLYADNGERPVPARRLGDLLLLLSTVGSAFERIIRQRKETSRKLPAAGGEAAGERWETREPPAALVPPALAPGLSEPWGASEPGRTAGGDALDGLEVDVDLGDDFVAEGVAPAGRGAPPAPAPPVATPPAALADQVLDRDAAVSASACERLGLLRRDPAVRPAAERLRRALLSGIASRATASARALGALRDVEAIPLLVQVLETSERDAAEAAALALREITLQPLGVDARGWLAWWKDNRGRGRAEWLFSGLTSAERETRLAAARELAALAPPPVDYSADMAPAERARAAREWAGWWSRSGRVL